MKRKLVLAGVLALTVAVGSALGDDKAGAAKRPGGKGEAKGKGGDMAEMMFKRLDANGDGKLSLEEFKKMAAQRPQGKLKDHPEMLEKIFQRMDENGDGFVSLEEFKKARAKMAEHMKNGKAGEKKPGEKKPDDK